MKNKISRRKLLNSKKILKKDYSKKQLLIASLIIFGVIGTSVLLSTNAATPVASIEPENSSSITSPAKKVADSVTSPVLSNNGATKFGAGGTGCTVSEKLVPSCGAFLGAWSGNHGVTGFRASIEEHETRIKRNVHVAHSYNSPGGVLDADEKYFINRPNTYLFANWKPSNSWATGGGGNATVNADIDKMADSIKSVAPKKLILTVHHEPENDVTGGASGCAAGIYKGSNGTPAEYRAMWINVQNRFAAKGVTNVVWAMTYMGFSNWDCMLDDLWPGDDRVDWMIWEPYYGVNETFEAATTKAYNKFTSLSAPGHNYASKPWGFGEWASWHRTTNPPQDGVYKLYDDARTTINAGKYPNLKMYLIYDIIGPAYDDRLEYTESGIPDPEEQIRYNLFANSPVFDHTRQ